MTTRRRRGDEATSARPRARAPLGALLVLALAGGAGTVRALDVGPEGLDRSVVDFWGEREGLPQSWVVSLAQTPDGYLWLSTLEGVVRFDGVRFLPVRRPDSERASSNRMGPLLLRRDGSLWVASENAGLFRVAGTELVLEQPAELMRLPSAMVEDRRGDLWIACEGTLHRLRRDGRFESSVAGLLASGAVSLAVTGDGTVWAATPRALLRSDGERFAPVPAERAPAGDPFALGVLRDGSLLVLASDGLYRREGERFLAVGGRLPFRPLPGAKILEDESGTVWVSAGREGLAFLKGGEWGLVPRRKGLAGTHVRALLQDREGSLWIGTEGRGLARLRTATFANLGTAEGLRDPFVWTHLRDREGTLWIGSQDGTLHAWTGGVLRAYGREEGLAGGGVRSLAETRDGALLVGTLGDGIRVRRGGRFVPLPGTEALSRDAVRTMREGPDGALWIGAESGLYRLSGGRLGAVGEGGLRRVVTCLLFDRSGRLWAGTTGEGLYVSSDAGATFRHLSRREGLPDASIRSLYEDPRGDLWVGTEGGGLATVREGRVVATVSRREGLFDNTVSVILDDGRGWLWMSCNRGVSRVRRSDLAELVDGLRPRVTCEVFDDADGLVSRECNGSSEPAGLVHPDGTLSFSTMGGVAFVDPASLAAAGSAPPVVLERLVHDGIAVPVGPRAILPPGRGNLEVQFTSPTFLGPDRVSFRYRLAPFDDWSEAVTRRSAWYTNVPPGTYRLEVVAIDRNGLASEAPAAVEVELRPHFWQRTDLRLLAAALLVAAAAVVYRRRVGRLKRHARELENEVAARTRDLAEANAELGRLATTDPGTGLANRRHLEAHLDEEWRRASRARTLLGVLMVDVDHFKAYNDRYGHPRGDEVLARVGATLCAAVRRPGDLAARYGGEEFALVLPGAGIEELRTVGERVRAGVAELGILHEGSASAACVTVSVGGAACSPTAATTPGELFRRADAALYEAKRGRNRVVVLGREDGQPAEAGPAGA